MSLIPFFEVNGERYEIRRTRYLMCELEKIRESSKIADEDQKNMVRLQEKYERLATLKQRSDELYDAYLESFTAEAEEMYNRAQTAYDKLFEEVTQFELNSNDLLHRMNKTVADNSEKLVIIALQRSDDGKIIRTREEAEKIWCAYVEDVGHKVAKEWLDAFLEHISGEDEREEEDNSFLSQAKARAEQRAKNNKKGLKKVVS